MPALTVAIVAQGAMGAATAARLSANGCAVVTSLEGRSEASAARARAAGMRPVDLAAIAAADIILSIVPPGEAKALAERLGPHLAAAARKPLFVDCNAVSSATVEDVGRVVTATGTPFIDGCIIGYPPKPGTWGTVYFFSGQDAGRLKVLGQHGLEVTILDGPVGAASALKMSYAAITKGLTAIASASILSAARYGAASALQAELARSQPNLMASLTRAVPDMFPKAYRFVGEMEEIADQSGRPSIAAIYQGMAALFDEIARDHAGEGKDTATLARFFKPPGA